MIPEHDVCVTNLEKQEDNQGGVGEVAQGVKEAGRLLTSSSL